MQASCGGCIVYSLLTGALSVSVSASSHHHQWRSISSTTAKKHQHQCQLQQHLHDVAFCWFRKAASFARLSASICQLQQNQTNTHQALHGQKGTRCSVRTEQYGEQGLCQRRETARAAVRKGSEMASAVAAMDTLQCPGEVSSKQCCSVV